MALLFDLSHPRYRSVCSRLPLPALSRKNRWCYPVGTIARCVNGDPRDVRVRRGDAWVPASDLA